MKLAVRETRCGGASVSDESSLIDRSLQGDSAAFGQLVRLHQDRLFNSVLHLAGDRAEAEDVVQEAFLQAYLKLGSFHRNSAFYTWLYRIAFNNTISRKRRKHHQASVDKHRDEGGDEPVARDDLPTEPLERAERAEQVQRALAELSDEHRSILVLREVDGCDYEAIADALDINIGTVRSRLHRARLQLRDRLKELYDH
jgi:RNA polymerase sigma-70 factor (ECF subfamily)